MFAVRYCGFCPVLLSSVDPPCIWLLPACVPCVHTIKGYGGIFKGISFLFADCFAESRDGPVSGKRRRPRSDIGVPGILRHRQEGRVMTHDPPPRGESCIYPPRIWGQRPAEGLWVTSICCWLHCFARSTGCLGVER